MIVGHASSSASAVILVLLAVALHAAFTAGDDAPSYADYIRAGLGFEGPLQIIHTEYQYTSVTEQHVVTVTGTGDPPTPAVDFAAASACSSSWSRYSIRASKNIVIKHVTTTIYAALSTELTYGTGDVYTTEPVYNIPVAHGNFTATSTGNRVCNITSTLAINEPVTLNTTIPTATPACSLIEPEQCSKLYVSYISSLGLPPNASVPTMTPAPANSPPCPDYYYKPFSTCTDSFVTSYPNDCTIFGNSVQLFYFPTPTSTASVDPTPSDARATITAPPAVIYEYAPGTTFTSPSIYLKFDYLSAERVMQRNDVVMCSICDELGCRKKAVDGGESRQFEGTSIEGQLVSLAPEEVSSIVLNFNDQEASSIIRTMAHGLPGYADVMNKVVGNFDVVAKRLSLDDVRHPPPEAYYLQPLDNAPGCVLSAPQPRCSTIFEGAYRALISLPQEVTGFQGAWKSCFPVIYGVYDPPIALTRASTADGATLPGYRPTANIPETTQTQTALPADLLQIPPIARPTALPIELPGQNENGNRPAGPTLPSSGASSGNAASSGGTLNGDGGTSDKDGGTSNNDDASSGTGAGIGDEGDSTGNNGAAFDNDQGASAGTGSASSNDGSGSSNNGGGSGNGDSTAGGESRGGGSGTNDNDGTPNGGNGGTGNTNGSNRPSDEDNGHTEGRSNGNGSSGLSRPSGDRATTRRPSATGTSTSDSDEGGSTSGSTSTPSSASAALPRNAIPFFALCLSMILSTTRLFMP